MLVCRAVVGHADDPGRSGRRVEHVDLAWHEASKSRMRRRTDAGTDVAIDIPRGTFLPDGAVLHDDGERIIVARRLPELALVVRFAAVGEPHELIEAVARIGHALGNQHVPIETAHGAILVPIVSGERVLRDTLAALELPGVELSLKPVALATRAPLGYGAAHTHDGHGRDH